MGLELVYNDGSEPKLSDLENVNADILYFYAHQKISNNICHFVTLEKYKTTCPFDGIEAARLPYLTVFY